MTRRQFAALTLTLVLISGLTILGGGGFDSVTFPGHHNDHKEITVKGLTNAGFSAACAEIAQDANTDVDYLETPTDDASKFTPITSRYVPSHHFDRNDSRHRNQDHGKAFKEGIDYLYERRDLVIAANNQETALKELGRALHALQDFFSHSNYVNLGTRVQSDLKSLLFRDSTNFGLLKGDLLITGFGEIDTRYDPYPHDASGFAQPFNELPLRTPPDWKISRYNIVPAGNSAAKVPDPNGPYAEIRRPGYSKDPVEGAPSRDNYSSQPERSRSDRGPKSYSVDHYSSIDAATKATREFGTRLLVEAPWLVSCAKVEITWDPNSPKPEQPVTFKVKSSDLPKTDPAYTWYWQFSEGSDPSPGPIAKYEGPGKYRVTLMAKGKTSTAVVATTDITIGSGGSSNSVTKLRADDWIIENVGVLRLGKPNARTGKIGGTLDVSTTRFEGIPDKSTVQMSGETQDGAFRIRGHKVTKGDYLRIDRQVVSYEYELVLEGRFDRVDAPSIFNGTATLTKSQAFSSDPGKTLQRFPIIATHPASARAQR